MIALAAPTKKQLTLLKNDMAAVKATLKTGKNLEKSEATMRKYLADTLYSNNAQTEIQIQQMLCDVLKKAYSVGNEKMYLKQATDTTCLVMTGKRMFLAYQRLDSLDAQQRQSGISEPTQRRRHAEFLMPYRTNIFMGGLYFMHKKEWHEAWECYDLYLQCPREPLFADMHLSDSDASTYRVAYLSLEMARRLDNYGYALKYADKSTLSHHRQRALQILADMALQQNDSLRAERWMREGFHDFPASDYFLPHLIDYYDGKGRYEESAALCDSALTIDSLNTMFLLGKHSVALQQKKYDESLVYGEKLLSINDSIDTPYYNIGLIHYMRGKDRMSQREKPYRQRLREAQKHYRRALPYMEKYRALRPDDKGKWRPILYELYLNLNMGKEFSEIERP